jgi:hypothetical protein
VSGFVTGHDLSRAAKWLERIPALAAAKLQITESKEKQGLKPNMISLLFRHD